MGKSVYSASIAYSTEVAIKKSIFLPYWGQIICCYCCGIHRKTIRLLKIALHNLAVIIEYKMKHYLISVLTKDKSSNSTRTKDN